MENMVVCEARLGRRSVEAMTLLVSLSAPVSAASTQTSSVDAPPPECFQNIGRRQGRSPLRLKPHPGLLEIPFPPPTWLCVTESVDERSRVTLTFPALEHPH